MKEKNMWLKFGEIKAKGWMYEQMKNDLENGFIGHLDQLVPDLILEDDIYGKNRLTKHVKSKDVGAISQDADWEVQYLWWNSETQSNWRDGYVRTALLTESEEYLKKTKDYVDYILSTQDEDGYLGIYEDDLRYNFDGENGELWAQSSLFRVLLGYYEATGEERVLEAVERAMSVTMNSYKKDKSDPFKAEKESYAGHAHGLTITDALDRLYQLTGKKEYADYAVWLYDNYNSNTLSEPDIQIHNLLDYDYKFWGHAVHTYEQLRTLIVAAYNSKEENYRRALDAYLNKLSYHLTPSGGPIGDEWVFQRAADSTETGYEYCSIHELLDSYSLLLQKSGDFIWADKMEWLLYNAGQGARHPHESLIAYCKTDNSYTMVGAKKEGKSHNGSPDFRFKYSPAHQDVAVCCVPNAGRVLPYFVKSMAMKTDKGIAIPLYGASSVNTEINGTKINVEQLTNYPFDLNVDLKISVEKEVEFELSLRKPVWAKDVLINGESVKSEIKRNKIIISKTWSGTEEIKVNFIADIELKTDLQGEKFVTRGPLLFALNLDAQEEVTKTFEVGTYRDLYYRPTNHEFNYLHLKDDSVPHFDIVMGEFNEKDPWSTSIKLTGDLYHSRHKQLEKKEFLPLGGTILRKVTFKG